MADGAIMKIGCQVFQNARKFDAKVAKMLEKV